MAERSNKWTRTANRIKCAKFQKRHSLHRITRTTTTSEVKREREKNNAKPKEWSRAQACWAVTSLAPFAWKKVLKKTQTCEFFSLFWLLFFSFRFRLLLLLLLLDHRCGQEISVSKKSSRWLVYWLFSLKRGFCFVFVLLIIVFSSMKS